MVGVDFFNKGNGLIPNDFSLENCLYKREQREYNPDCPLLNKLNIPEEHQSAYQELFHIFVEPQLLKLIITDRILGKTTNFSKSKRKAES